MNRLDALMASMTGLEKVNWAAYDSYGRATVFLAPERWSKSKAMELAELLYPDKGFGFVTVAEL